MNQAPHEDFAIFIIDAAERECLATRAHASIVRRRSEAHEFFSNW